MKYRTFYKTGLTVSEIGIGTNRFGHNVDQKEVNKSQLITTISPVSGFHKIERVAIKEPTRKERPFFSASVYL